MKKHKILCGFLCLLLILLVVVGVVYFSGTRQLKKRPAQVPNLAGGENWYWQGEDILMADGKAYHPKTSVTTVLGIGLGSSQERETNGFNRGMMPMADTLVLAVVDRRAATLDLLAIPRDTQADLDWSLADCPLPPQKNSHLALQYRYGGPDRETCSQSTCDAVSRLLFDMGISGCVTIDMDSVSAFTELIGGVPLTIPNDPWYCAYTGYTPGQWIRMDGPTALQFVQYRDLSIPGSCEMRVERQKVFLDALLSWAGKGLRTRPWRLPYALSQMEPYYYTNLRADEIAALGLSLIRMNIREVTMQTLPGTVTRGEIYEEYHLDKPAVRQLLLNLFYEPAN